MGSLSARLVPDAEPFAVTKNDRILVTGATGFIGSRVVHRLAELGFRKIRCFARPSSDLAGLQEALRGLADGADIELLTGNLLSREDCLRATLDVSVVLHLAAARSKKSFPDEFLNSVVTTRNLVGGTLRHGCLRRFVTISSFTVYTNSHKRRRTVLDESCPVERHPERRGNAYTFAKVRQDELVEKYGEKFGLPYVIVRPGYVYGAGNETITDRVGISTFGVFLHLGGSNPVPVTFVDNCADAIVLAAVKNGIDGQVFNIVDDDLPSSRTFLRAYKKRVRSFKSIYLPHAISYALCAFWEKYSDWSEGQLPPAFNRLSWHALWKKTRYSNEKAKALLGWSPKVSTPQGLELYFESCRTKVSHA